MVPYIERPTIHSFPPLHLTLVSHTGFIIQSHISRSRSCPKVDDSPSRFSSSLCQKLVSHSFCCSSQNNNNKKMMSFLHFIFTLVYEIKMSFKGTFKIYTKFYYFFSLLCPPPQFRASSWCTCTVSMVPDCFLADVSSPVV